MKTSAQTITLSRTQLYAAWLACSNYVPADKRWKQAAQAKAATKLQRALSKANDADSVRFTK